MALEPLEPTLEEGPNPELIVMNRRMWACAALSVPVAARAHANVDVVAVRTGDAHGAALCRRKSGVST